MLRRSSTVALAAGVLTLVVFSAGSPEPTSVALGLLCFLSGVTALIGWEHVKRSIIEQTSEDQRDAAPQSYEDHRSTKKAEASLVLRETV